MSLKEHVYATAHNKNIIILNGNSGKYHVIEEEYYDVLIKIFTSPFDTLSSEVSGKSNQKIIDSLRELHILEETNFKLFSHNPIRKNKKSPGLANLSWKIPSCNDAQFSTKMFIQSFFWIIVSHLLLKYKGMNGLFRLLQKKHLKKSKKHSQSNEELINSYMKALKYAIFFCPYKTKCLEWAAAMYVLLRNNSVDTDFNIGVQNMPFYAHAWLTFEGNTLVSQDKEANEKLSLIFSTGDK